jgi:hypothetical protein
MCFALYSCLFMTFYQEYYFTLTLYSSKFFVFFNLILLNHVTCVKNMCINCLDHYLKNKIKLKK